MAKTNGVVRLSCAFLFGVSLFGSGQVQADRGGNIRIQSFRPALDSKGIVTLERAQVLGPWDASFGLVTHMGTGLLHLESGGNTYDIDTLISPTLVGAMGVSLWGQDLQLALAIPFPVVHGKRGPIDTMGTPDNPNDDRKFSFDGQGLGNASAQLKWRIWDTSHHVTGLALVLGADLPTAGAASEWLGADGLTTYGTVVINREFSSLGVALNVGVEIPFGSDDFVDDSPPMRNGIPGPMTGLRVASGLSIPMGIGVSYPIVPGHFDLVSEVIGAVVPNAENYQPLEALVGSKFYLAQNSFLSLGVGAGLMPTRGGNPDFRGFVGIVFEPSVGDMDNDGFKDDVDRCPQTPEDFDDFEDSDGCPELDNDLDQINDVDDACPNIPENRNGVEDEDGCPEDLPKDRDGDGIVDHLDSCPDDPEDMDDFEDEDGCPDPDNDIDYILDIDDLCPNSSEDMDGFEDLDGCPELDNDLDRIVDADDQCPRIDGQTIEETAETYNTVDDEDGCPDRGPVRKVEGGIVILKKIHFEYDSDQIKQQSFGILHAVAMTIKTNPDMGVIEVQGHTDERGSAEYNRVLSQRRAEAVLVFLQGDGVAASRLRAMGYGEDMPKSRRHSPAAWAENRRVEFVILP